MRKLSDMTGLKYTDPMREALGRLEAGEDPEAVEARMGDILEEEEMPFVLPEKRRGSHQRPAPRRDDTLYEM
jgi:hypothetical protein